MFDSIKQAMLDLFYGKKEDIIAVREEIRQSNTDSIIIQPEVRQLTEQVQEQKQFTRSNNLIDEFLDGPPPALINGDGSVFYKVGDPRNTYDPFKVHQVEDYDGSILTYGGEGIKEVPDNPEDVKEWNEGVDNSSDKARLDKNRKEWMDKNKMVNYTDMIKPKTEDHE